MIVVSIDFDVIVVDETVDVEKKEMIADETLYRLYAVTGSPEVSDPIA